MSESIWCKRCQSYHPAETPHFDALPHVRSEPLFGGKWTDSDLKAFATARCREVRRKYTREQAQAMCEEMAQMWDIGNDYLTPNNKPSGSSAGATG